MKDIELSSIESIINDDSALGAIVKKTIGFEEGNFRFVLPIGTSPEIKQKLDIFGSKMNFDYERFSRPTKLFPCLIKEPAPVVVVPEPVVIPEPAPVVVPEPVPAPTQAFVSKRKK